MIEKSWNFQTVVSGLYISDFDTHEALLQIPQSSNAPNSIGSTGIFFLEICNIDIFFYFPYWKVLLFTDSLQVVSHECTTAIPNSPNLVRQSSLNKTENRLTRISLAIVWVFIFCHIWKLIPTMYEAVNWFTSSRNEVWNNFFPWPKLWRKNIDFLLFQAEESWPNWLRIVNDISHTLIVFNSAVNFLIYSIL